MTLMITICVIKIETCFLRKLIFNYPFIDLVKCVKKIAISQYK